jgi:predicted esterase
MRARDLRGPVVVFAMAAGAPSFAQTPKDIADTTFKRINVGRGAARSAYYLIGRDGVTDAPEGGFGLAIVLPGGDGQGRKFSAFVRRIHKYVLDETWLIALGTARKWSRSQVIVWPTRKGPVKGMKYTTEEYVAAVIADAKKRQAIDPKRVILMGWSSSGPACYATALAENKDVTGYYILMSVFKPDQLPPLEKAKGRNVYIEHGKNDKTCPIRMAREAAKALKAAGANVEFVEHDGGHGFSGPVYPRMKRAFEWLVSAAEKAATTQAAEDEPKEGKKATGKKVAE